ncbi:MAG TPA: BamA/TamA family outer membrane protein [Abditibacteriaceae bacterium]|jgi:outer membrane protein insertion porin family
MSHHLLAAGFSLALAGSAVPLAFAAPAAKGGTIITSTDIPVSVHSWNIAASGHVGARFSALHSGSNRLSAPISAASVASLSRTSRASALMAPSLALRPRLSQNVPDGAAAAPREEPRGLETPVGPESKDPLPTPAAPPDGGNNAGTVAAPPAVVTPGVETPPVVAPTTETPAQIDAEGRPIALVRVVGNRVVPEASILLQAATQRGAAYSGRQIDLDRAKIDALGLFASVQSQVTPNLEDPTRVDVTFIVVENRVVTGFKFEGNKSISEADLLKVITSKTGNVLNRNTVNADIEAIQTLYRERGFAGLVTESRQLEDGTIVFVIQEGTISRINLSGLKKTKESLLRKQIRTKPGDPFNQARLRLDLNRIYDTGFFEDVSYRVSDDADNPGSVIVTILVKEKRTGQLSLGVGFDNRSKVTGFASVADSNFRGSGRRVTAGLELGSRRTFELGFGDPFIGRNNASFDVSIFNRVIFREPRSVARVAGVPTNTQAFSYEEERVGARVNFTKPLDLDREKNLLFGYRNEKARLFQTDSTGTIAPINLPQNATGRVSAPSFGFLRDNRDLRTDPSKGGREQFIVEQGIKLLGGSSSFTKVDLDLRRYFPIIKAQKADELPKLVFAGRFVVGRSFGQLPAFEQYFVGGTDTVRGYDVDEQFGDNQIYSNLELRYRFQRKFTIVGFIDAGSASGGQFSSSNQSTLFSFGAGVRVQTPIGPIRLDVGKGREGVRTHFGIGPTF